MGLLAVIALGSLAATGARLFAAFARPSTADVRDRGDQDTTPTLLPTPDAWSLDFENQAGPSVCPGQERLRGHVSEQLGRDPFSGGSGWSIQVVLKVVHRELRALVRVIDPMGRARGERGIAARSMDCEELLATAALAICIAVDPLRPLLSASPLPGVEGVSPDEGGRARIGRRRAERADATAAPKDQARIKTAAVLLSKPHPGGPSEAEDVRSPKAREQPRPGTSLSAEPRPGQRAWRPWFLGPTLRGGIGMTVAALAAPELALGGRLRVALRWQQYSMALEGHADLPASRQVAGGGELRTALRVANLVSCLQQGRFGWCGVLSGGIQVGEGHGLAQGRSVRAPYLAVGARGRAELSVARSLWTDGWIELAFPLSRATYRVGQQTVWSTPAVTLSLGIGLVGEPW